MRAESVFGVGYGCKQHYSAVLYSNSSESLKRVGVRGGVSSESFGRVGGGVYRRGEVEGGEIGRRLKGSAKLMPVKNSKLC